MIPPLLAKSEPPTKGRGLFVTGTARGMCVEEHPAQAVPVNLARYSLRFRCREALRDFRQPPSLLLLVGGSFPCRDLPPNAHGPCDAETLTGVQFFQKGFFRVVQGELNSGADGLAEIAAVERTA